MKNLVGSKPEAMASIESAHSIQKVTRSKEKSMCSDDHKVVKSFKKDNDPSLAARHVFFFCCDLFLIILSRKSVSRKIYTIFLYKTVSAAFALDEALAAEESLFVKNQSFPSLRIVHLFPAFNYI